MESTLVEVKTHRLSLKGQGVRNMEFHVGSTGLDQLLGSRLGSSLLLMILVGSSMFPMTKRPSGIEIDTRHQIKLTF